ncbi:RIP metalloprotease RseP [Flammeovirga sp. MY04]|uniref:RIP metalloprotease RseP n=1 Tax=Flammeovirga sp. MY04 TaxID=1191459 RepID=UPI0008063C79|nr:RIP metalloprotease RseP [Flammeovirga sp. MY04]ANQ50759.1 RIP metalloprotease RseP [Flammeovirga sp. MY04]
MDALVMAAQLIAGLSILVGIHEFGHFAAAKIFKIRVNKFYLFFDFLFPFPNLLKFSIFKFKKGDTEYGLGWFPMGGYVDIAGMIDESKGADDLESVPQPWEFRTKPAWQRLIVMMGGIIMNVITGIVIFIGMNYHNGETYIPIEEVNKYGVYASKLGEKIGIRTGDKIINANGEKVTRYSDITDGDFFFADDNYLTVLRDGKEVKVVFPKETIDWMSDKEFENMRYVYPRYPFKVKRLLEGYPAEQAGLKEGDEPIAINGVDVPYFFEFTEELSKYKEKEVTLSVNRGGQIIDLKLAVNENGKVGFEPQFNIKFESHPYTLEEAIPVGTKQAFNVIILQIKGFAKIFKGEVSASKSIQSPIGMAKIYGSVWDWNRFWTLTGLLSMVLAFMNFLPIPALDGGHVVFLTYEMITRKKPSEKVLMVAQQIGMLLLLSIMIFAFGNDIFKLFQ